MPQATEIAVLVAAGESACGTFVEEGEFLDEIADGAVVVEGEDFPCGAAGGIKMRGRDGDVAAGAADGFRTDEFDAYWAAIDPVSGDRGWGSPGCGVEEGFGRGDGEPSV